jgi:hypothetical protein
VVEVDVREHEVSEVAHRETPVAESALQRFQARARPTVHEGGLVLHEQVRGDDTRSPEMKEIDELEATAT